MSAPMQSGLPTAPSASLWSLTTRGWSPGTSRTSTCTRSGWQPTATPPPTPRPRPALPPPRRPPRRPLLSQPLPTLRSRAGCVGSRLRRSLAWSKDSPLHALRLRRLRRPWRPWRHPRPRSRDHRPPRRAPSRRRSRRWTSSALASQRRSPRHPRPHRHPRRLPVGKPRPSPSLVRLPRHSMPHQTWPLLPNPSRQRSRR
mmetsp:Transcript_5918/g.22966  ORF Transcript_5918/g.22966 Transcript_5918/m.22966 type:complete len:200 (+) Transcript_5918:366-965(+)